jgi:hypothetical protein
MSRWRIALVFPDHRLSGGVTRVAAFLHETIQGSGKFESLPVSLAMFSGDRCSSLIRAPRTWRMGPRAVQESWEGIPICHAGALFAELEFMRYRGRSALSGVLDRADLIQVVAGSPAWALPCMGLGKPMLLQAATMATWERAQALAGNLTPAKVCGTCGLLAPRGLRESAGSRQRELPPSRRLVRAQLEEPPTQFPPSGSGTAFASTGLGRRPPRMCRAGAAPRAFVAKPCPSTPP